MNIIRLSISKNIILLSPRVRVCVQSQGSPNSTGTDDKKWKHGASAMIPINFSTISIFQERAPELSPFSRFPLGIPFPYSSIELFPRYVITKRHKHAVAWSICKTRKEKDVRSELRHELQFNLPKGRTKQCQITIRKLKVEPLEVSTISDSRRPPMRIYSGRIMSECYSRTASSSRS